MSRIGKLPVVVPDKVKIEIAAGSVTVKGPNGSLSERMPEGVSVLLDGTQLVVSRVDESRQARAAHGLARTLVANMVTGVTTGFSKRLAITGVGYRCEAKGDRWLLFSLGYSHPILFELPVGIAAKVDPKENTVLLSGASRQLLGATAAEIRSLRPPEPYKGKGVRYTTETIRRKEGKSGGKGK